MRIKCWSALNKFDSSSFSTSLRVFLSVCAENRLRDIKRSVLYKHNKPCVRCPFWNQSAAQSGMHDCLVFNDKMDCYKYNRHERYIQAKLSASHPIDIDNERVIDEGSNIKFNHVDFLDYIYTNIPSGYTSSFNKLQITNFHFDELEDQERNDLIDILREVLSNFQED